MIADPEATPAPPAADFKDDVPEVIHIHLHPASDDKAQERLEIALKYATNLENGMAEQEWNYHRDLEA